ncbi:MAG: putative cytosol aminopeptidase [Parcubacteria group bacterium]|nr:putative cytosol aminopeptidase [Parcubacteria group bacterium]
MKITLAKDSIEKAPKGYVRVRFVPEKGVKRLVREGGTDTIELGVATPMNRRKFITLCRSIVTTAKQFKAKKIAVQFDTTPWLWKGMEQVSPEDLSRLAAENYEMANFEFTKFKTKPKEGWNTVEEIIVYGPWDKAVDAGAKRGQMIGDEVNKTRSLANTPGGDMTPKGLAQAAKNAVQGLPVTVTTLTMAQMKSLGMGALLGVGKGSIHPPTFTIMEYKGAADAPIVLAGKGITFDSGGLNLKPSNAIYEMHMDMSGAAAVIHTVALAARLKLKKHVIGLIPSAENMPGNEAYRPGDILRSMSGKTIEVLNTDAEGRLVLADAITYAKKFKPSVVIDVATLTGAALSALGLYASGVMSRDESLAQNLTKLGEESGDYVWPLPLWDEYEAAIQGTFADITNIGTGQSGRYGGAIEGGIFLWQFAKELACPWAHLDIAPRMTAAPGEELAKGAAGAPVRLLIRFIESWKP